MTAPVYSDPNFPSRRLFTAGLDEEHSDELYAFYIGWSAYYQKALRQVVAAVSNDDLALLDGSPGEFLAPFYSATPDVPTLPGGSGPPSENPYPQYATDDEVAAALAGKASSADLAGKADAATVTALTATVAAKVDAAKMPVLVKGFATGDGTTDDRAAILAAEAMAVLTGRALDFGGPENVYRITDKLTVASSRRWVGSGAVVKLANGFTAAAALEITGTSDVSVTGIKFDGNRANVSGSSSVGIGVSVNPGGVGGTLTGLTLDVEVCETNSYGIKQIGTLNDATLTGRVHDTDHSGVSFQGDGVHGLDIRGLRLNSCGSTTAHVGLQVFGANYSNSDVTVSDVTAANCSGIPIEMQWIDGLTYTNCKALGSGLRGHSFGGVRNFTIANVLSVGQDTYGMELNTMTRGAVTNFTAYDCDSGIGGEKLVDVTIDHPVVVKTHSDYAVPHGIHIQTAGTKRLDIIEPHLTDISGIGIRVTHAPEQVKIRGGSYVITDDADLLTDPIAVRVDDWVNGSIDGLEAFVAQSGPGGATVGVIQLSASSANLHIKRTRIVGTGGSPLAHAGISGATTGSTGLRIRDNDLVNLATGVYTAGMTTDDATVRGNRAESCTTPYNLKSTHARSTAAYFEGAGSPEGSVAAVVGSVYHRLDGSAGTTFYLKTSGTGNTGWTSAGASADVQTFNANGTWTKPAGYSTAAAICVGGGGGGGAGRRGAAASVRSGGAGGGGGSRAVRTMPMSALGATVSVTVGAAGTAGAAASVNDTNGGAGGAGGTSAFGAHLQAAGGGAGAGGNTAAASAGAAGPGQFSGGAGAASSATGTVGTAGASSFDGASGGASGGGITAADGVSAGGAGAVPLASGYAAATAGTSGGGNGNAGTATPTGEGLGGPSGAGGGSSITGAGGNGGAGAIYGGGGGGGGASVNGANSGAGGAGGAGVVIVISQ